MLSARSPSVTNVTELVPFAHPCMRQPSRRLESQAWFQELPQVPFVSTNWPREMQIPPSLPGEIGELIHLKHL